MRAVAEGLCGAASAGAPEIPLTGLHRDAVGLFLRGYRFVHCFAPAVALASVRTFWRRSVAARTVCEPRQADKPGRRLGLPGGVCERRRAEVSDAAEEDHMAVYTDVADDELRAFIALYDVGEVLSCKGIAEGVENSNFLVTTERGNFILTLYEKRVAPKDLPFFIALMEHLARLGVACPTPVHGRDGIALRELCGRPAAMVTFLAGMWPRRIQPFHCAGVGAALAALHRAGASFGMTRANDLSVAGWRPLLKSSLDRAGEVQPGLAAELEAELELIESAWPRDLPTGVIHADLFPDNVFFRGREVSGLIDFYFACTDFLAYDLAICMNAWCFEADGSLNVTKARLLLEGYRRARPLTTPELAALPLLARGSALRFLLTRLFDWLNQPAGAMVRPKDPLEFLRKLRFHRGVADLRGYGLDA
jgi:homoserine kinase type II